MDQAKHALIIVTISIADHYVCNDSQVCSLPGTVTYAVCQNLQCRAEEIGMVSVNINSDTLYPTPTRVLTHQRVARTRKTKKRRAKTHHPLTSWPRRETIVAKQRQAATHDKHHG